MDESSGKILVFKVVQVSEVTSSNAMEPEGCNRRLNTLLKKRVNVRCLATDRHTTVSSNMRKLYPNIIYQYDTWHLAKWVVKKLPKKPRPKDVKTSVSGFNAFPTTCGGVLLRRKSKVYHGSRLADQVTKLCKKLFKKIFLNDFKMLTEFHHTGQLEVFDTKASTFSSPMNGSKNSACSFGSQL